MLLLATVLRLVVVLAYRPAFLLQRDAYSYLKLAVESSFTPSTFRPPLYSILFLKPLLAFGSLMTVAVVQHAAALAVSVLLYLLLRRLGVGPVIAALGVAPLLLDGYQLDVEHYVLTETFFEMVVASSLMLLVWRARPGPGAVALAGLLLAVAALTRFVGIALIFPALAYVALSRMGWYRVTLLLLTFALPLIAYSAFFKSSSGTFGVTNRNGFFLYGRVASFVDCARVDMPGSLRRFCLADPPSERAASSGVWTLGLDMKRLERTPGANSSLLEFSRRAILGQPLDYARAVLGDLGHFFAWSPPHYEERYVLRWRFPRSLAGVRAHPYVVRHGGSAPPGMGFESFEIDGALAGPLRAYQGAIQARGPMLALLSALALAGSALPLPTAEGRRLRAACGLFVASALVLLLVPVMTTVYHFRYVLPVLVLLGPAGALGCASLLSRRRERVATSTARAATTPERRATDEPRGGPSLRVGGERPDDSRADG